MTLLQVIGIIAAHVVGVLTGVVLAVVMINKATRR